VANFSANILSGAARINSIKIHSDGRQKESIFSILEGIII
jgi:hypothetical protein